MSDSPREIYSVFLSFKIVPLRKNVVKRNGELFKTVAFSLKINSFQWDHLGLIGKCT